MSLRIDEMGEKDGCVDSSKNFKRVVRIDYTRRR